MNIIQDHLIKKIIVISEAINFANDQQVNNSRAPTNLTFLEIITEFSTRLTAQDKKSV